MRVLVVGPDGTDSSERSCVRGLAELGHEAEVCDLRRHMIPGVPDATQLVVITRRKLRDTSLEEFTAAPRLLEGAEWEEAAKFLVDRRRSRVGPPADSLNRWRGSCYIVELTPNVAA